MAKDYIDQNYVEKDLFDAMNDYMAKFQTESATRSRLAGLESEVARIKANLPDVEKATDNAWRKISEVREWFNAGPERKY